MVFSVSLNFVLDFEVDDNINVNIAIKHILFQLKAFFQLHKNTCVIEKETTHIKLAMHEIKYM